MQQEFDHPLHQGKYRIAPLIKTLEDGWFGCSVSIRSGSGRSMTDRVLRLTGRFQDARAAAHYARGEGLQWVGASGAAALA